MQLHFYSAHKSEVAGTSYSQVLNQNKINRQWVKFQRLRQADSQTAMVNGVGRDGALVESMPFDRRVMGLNPALAAM